MTWVGIAFVSTKLLKFRALNGSVSGQLLRYGGLTPVGSSTPVRTVSTPVSFSADRNGGYALDPSAAEAPAERSPVGTSPRRADSVRTSVSTTATGPRLSEERGSSDGPRRSSGYASVVPTVDENVAMDISLPDAATDAQDVPRKDSPLDPQSADTVDEETAEARGWLAPAPLSSSNANASGSPQASLSFLIPSTASRLTVDNIPESFGSSGRASSQLDSFGSRHSDPRHSSSSRVSNILDMQQGLFSDGRCSREAGGTDSAMLPAVSVNARPQALVESYLPHLEPVREAAAGFATHPRGLVSSSNSLIDSPPGRKFSGNL